MQYFSAVEPMWEQGSGGGQGRRWREEVNRLTVGISQNGFLCCLVQASNFTDGSVFFVCK